MEILKKIFKRKKENISNESKEDELVNVEFFIKPWLYKINFTFADKNNPCYSKRDCYKEATGECLLEKKVINKKRDQLKFMTHVQV